MLSIQLTKDIIKLGISNPVIGIISNINNIIGECPQLKNKILNEYNNIKSKFDQILSKNESKGFRMLFDKLGSNIVPAGERLLTSFCKNGFTSYNNLIDAYNIVSMKYCSGIGLHNYNHIAKKIVVCLSDGEKKIVPLFKNKEIVIKNGDLIYLLDENVMAWLGKRDVDSNLYKVNDNTTTIIIVILGNEYTSKEFNLRIIQEIYDNILLFSNEVTINTIEKYELI